LTKKLLTHAPGYLILRKIVQGFTLHKIRLVQTAVASLLSLSLAGVAFSQTPLTSPQKPSSAKIFGSVPTSAFSLLDRSRLQLHHSYSFSYVSSGKYSGSYGLYQTSIGYQFSNPLYLQVDLGYLHQPFGFKNNLNLDDRFFPNFHLLYNPTGNFSFSINVLTGPSNFQNNRNWYQEDR